MEKSSGNVWKRLVHFLRKIRLFEAFVNIAWSFSIVAMSFFLDYQNLNIHVPDAVALTCIAIITIVGFILWIRLRKNEHAPAVIQVYRTFYYIIPIVVNIIKIILIDSLYSYGGFMPGLEELGNFVMCIALTVIAIIGCIIFNVVRRKKRKRFEKKRKEDCDTDNYKIIDCLNVILFAVLILALLGLGITWCVENIKKSAYKAELARNEEYRKEVLTSLIESDIYEKAVWNGVNEDGTIDRGEDTDVSADSPALFDEAENELCWEAYTYSLFVEALAKDRDISEEDVASVGISTIAPEVCRQGVDNYTEFTKQYIPERGVEMVDQDIVYDSGNRIVSVSSELYCEDEKNNCMVHACMVVVFDKEWKVIEIRCQDEALKQYVPY